jgi:uncharacterized protein YihD (DUF1040 family)
MLSDKQKKLLDTLTQAWAKRPGLRLGQLLDEASYRSGYGEPALVCDEDIEQALREFVGLPRK